MNTTTHANAHAATRYQTSRREALAIAEAIVKALRNAADVDNAADDIDAGDMANAAQWLIDAGAAILPITDPTDRGPRMDLPF